MDWVTIVLIILGIVVTIGIIRVIINPSESFGELIIEILLIDLLGDILQAIFESFD